MCRHSCGAGRLGGCQLLITCYGACSRSTGQRQGLLKTHIAKCGFGTPNLKGFLPFPALAKMNCEPPSPYTQISTLALEEEVLCKESFLKHERDWAASLVESKRLAIRHQFLPYKAGIKILLWYNSCVCCPSMVGRAFGLSPC